MGDVADGAALDTSTAGARTFTVTATDVAGNSASLTVAYEVGPLEDDFMGFRRPVEDFPAINRWIAGETVPVRFSLGGFKGLDVLAPGYPQVAEVECAAGEEPDERPAGPQRLVAEGPPLQAPQLHVHVAHRPRLDPRVPPVPHPAEGRLRPPRRVQVHAQLVGPLAALGRLSAAAPT